MPDPLPSSQLGGFSPSPPLLEALNHHLSFKSGDSVAIALSGGADSAMLAVHAHIWASRRQVTLHFFHIHHGLQAMMNMKKMKCELAAAGPEMGMYRQHCRVRTTT